MTLVGGNPIWLGRAVSVSALILLVLLFHNKIKFYQFSILFILPFVVLLSAGSKGPMIALAIAVIMIFLHKIKKFLKSRKFLVNSFLISIFVIPLSLIAFLISPASFLRLFDLASESATSERLIFFEDALSLTFKNPFGVGLGNFGDFSSSPYPHNLVLEAFAELGWIPGFFLICIILASFIGFIKFSKGTIHGDILLGLFIMTFINSMVSGDLTSPKELYVLLPIGLNMMIFNTSKYKGKNQITI